MEISKKLGCGRGFQKAQIKGTVVIEDGRVTKIECQLNNLHRGSRWDLLAYYNDVVYGSLKSITLHYIMIILTKSAGAICHIITAELNSLRKHK